VTRPAFTTALLVALLAGGAQPAWAQESAGRFEIAIGPVVTNGLTLSSGAATETTSSAGSFTLFSTTTTLARAEAAELRIGVGLGTHLEAVGALSYGKPRLRIAASGDAENAASITATERVEAAILTAGVLWYPGVFDEFTRVAPFLTAEAGYLRILHEELTFVQDSRTFIVGGGVKLVMHHGRAIKAIGARIDARGVARERGLFPKTRVSPAVGASLFFRF